MKDNKHRSFLKSITIGAVGAAMAPASLLQLKEGEDIDKKERKKEKADNPAKAL